MANNMLDSAQVIVDYLIREKVPYAFTRASQRAGRPVMGFAALNPSYGPDADQ
jgi:hypothetical protein